MCYMNEWSHYFFISIFFAWDALCVSDCMFFCMSALRRVHSNGKWFSQTVLLFDRIQMGTTQGREIDPFSVSILLTLESIFKMRRSICSIFIWYLSAQPYTIQGFN